MAEKCVEEWPKSAPLSFVYLPIFNIFSYYDVSKSILKLLTFELRASHLGFVVDE